MLPEIVIGSAMIVLTTLIQGVFTMVGVEKMGDYVDRHNEPGAYLVNAASLLLCVVALPCNDP